ncbi:NAD(P)-dependent oxidoreductase [Achromobacter denitrificans]|jgi:3-hydroxyisobutyrate dehydrogenase|uniref:NAD(P)-dependent oxidoreductase n=2 Tax=Achromobacter denitrificans TaxID=32002 RepID=A0A427WVW7_ACHDE|nr:MULTISPECIES: NAD(P)-dependent oxidoreductase [Achromobacter]ASC65126.1 hydroxyacid oxidoreductase [Achromobacter denitrificans]MBV2160022.1 NAD(P)-dependent oxidoreductase [Achromobacter denitrificans]MDF3847070.1 NAD(P)-dependent oxidoreductase [Achromobacter denitrificans]MDX3877192.1 NAD(P)-dependent oxidoreductase [Achromobacter sp.]OLU09811.1 hydroxyacid oxidoreductase [Achromobacter denitrificans]
MNTSQARVGLIGIGSMGWPMAARLVQAGFAVTVFDAVPGQAAKFAKEVGGQAAATCAELAGQADIIFTMLPTSAIVEQVLGGEQGVLAGLRPGSVVVDMSSGVPAHTQRLAQAVAAAGGEMVDAPVSGGVPRARTGELAIMFGGPAETLERVRPALSSMGTSITPVGAVGSAHAMKALNNLVSAGGFLIGVEAMLIGQQFGLDPNVIVDVLNASTGMNNSTQKKFKQFVLSRQFNSGFGLDLMVKDLGIALGIATDTGTPTPFASLCRELWASAGKTLGQGQDHTAVARLSEQLAGVELGKRKD